MPMTPEGFDRIQLLEDRLQLLRSELAETTEDTLEWSILKLKTEIIENRLKLDTVEKTIDQLKWRRRPRRDWIGIVPTS